MAADSSDAEAPVPGYDREDGYGRIEWEHVATGIVVQLNRHRGPAARKMTPSTARSGDTDEWWTFRVRPASGEPPEVDEELRTYDRPAAVDRAREWMLDHPRGMLEE